MHIYIYLFNIAQLHQHACGPVESTGQGQSSIEVAFGLQSVEYIEYWHGAALIIDISVSRQLSCSAHSHSRIHCLIVKLTSLMMDGLFDDDYDCLIVRLNVCLIVWRLVLILIDCLID